MQTNSKLIHDEFAVQPVLYTGLIRSVNSTPWTSTEATNLGLLPSTKLSDSIEFPHPVAQSLARYGKGADRMHELNFLASTQGKHAPLRLAMERRIMQRIQPRLPGLYSYHPLAAQLDGTLDEIDIADFINPPEDAEVVGNPQLMMEHKLGLL